MNKKVVGVCLTPRLMDQFPVSESIVVVIDILRATTTMCVALKRGADHILPMKSVEECREQRENGYLITGERGGVIIDDFDYGNSPLNYLKQDLKGKKIAFTTTNGTYALKVAQEHNAQEILIGAFSNISILCDYLAHRNQNVLLLCAGYKGRPNLEDTIFAGAVVKKIRPQFKTYEDTAIIAETLYAAANRNKKYFIKNSSHFARLKHLEIEEDVKYCMKRDTQKVLPMLDGNIIRDSYLNPEIRSAIQEQKKFSLASLLKKDQ